MIVCFMLSLQHTSAISGANTFFPDTSMPGEDTTYAIVQLSPGGVWIKARTTIANIYVPESLLNTQIAITIQGGCDSGPNSGRDYSGAIANTSFAVAATGGNNGVLSDSVCASGQNDIPYSFKATPNYDANGVMVNKKTEGKIIFTFVASALGNELNGRYLNAFRILIPNPSTGVEVGVSNVDDFQCDIARYPNSCPKKRDGPLGNLSYTYSSFYGNSPAGYYGQRIKIRNKCATTTGSISLYDLDANNTSLAQNIRIHLYKDLTRGGTVARPSGSRAPFPIEEDRVSFNTPLGPFTELPHEAVKNWGPGWTVAGKQVIKPHPGFGGNENEYIDLPPVGDTTFDGLNKFEANIDYIIEIVGINNTNAIQMRTSLELCAGQDNPVGYIDSCEVIAGETYIKGWAYDDNGTAGSEPSVEVTIGGNTRTAVTDRTYRAKPIDDFLNNQSYGTRQRGTPYGFELKYNNLYDQNLSISGNIIDVGSGESQKLGLRRDNVIRDGLTGYGFSGDKIPIECLIPRPPTPTCSINPIAVTVGEDFYLQVSITSAQAFTITGPANYTLSGPKVVNGQGLPYNAGTNSYGTFPYSLPAGGTLLIRSQLPALKAENAGQYSVKWDVVITPGSPSFNAGGDCGSVKSNAVDATNKPYVRFYGNDVFAGGGYGDDCSVSSSANASGFGWFGGTPKSQSNYKGSASELAVFATGQIDGVLPGSQDVGRSSLTAFSFSNSSIGSGSLPFGGGFGDIMCADNYWSERPSGLTPLIPTGKPPGTYSNQSADIIDINSLASGNYYYGGNPNSELHIYTDANSYISAGKRITIYVDGTTVIGRTGTSSAPNKIAYNTSAPWASIDQIPLIKIITLGNIYIDNDISQLDGLYVAVPKPGVDSSGEISTCSLFSDLDLTRPTLNETGIATGCYNKLEVNGAFVAKKVKLLRINGNIMSAPNAPEMHDSASIAESFRFSPELYLALLSEGAKDISGKFDSILSLPPAL